MKVYIEKTDETKDLDVGSKKVLKNVVKNLNISLDSVVLVKNGEVCLEDEMVCDEDEIKLLSVVSGG